MLYLKLKQIRLEIRLCLVLGAQLDTISDWKLRFYGMLGAFCVLVISIGLLVAYIIIITR